ncbi:transmembrane protein, putative (macronuclear) [Tetrahymena thermophila SB210]|uniref:Transmembrane protein, putative n=1 Tax=Tetrahymena thermophila (strain SB210) TaxID=312017 RepID=W7XCN0_TETTS|nr:transmembrane protein, putative [Tetrahymena thermophila SB210]EWS71536.1 transmembrane protein, putative [Tetrahymena thermophila SB210]|eukprot:XP_012655919.1 transmembrane protein, putative [Tetrahymena thermophila SB210]
MLHHFFMLSGKRTICFYQNTILLAKFYCFFIETQRVNFKLIHFWFEFTFFNQMLEMVNIKVTDSNMFNYTCFSQLYKGLPCFETNLGVFRVIWRQFANSWPMDQNTIQIFNIQASKHILNSFFGLFITLFTRTYFRSDKQVFTFNSISRIVYNLCYILFISINASSINMSISNLKCFCYSYDAVILTQLISTVADLRNAASFTEIQNRDFNFTQFNLLSFHFY